MIYQDLVKANKEIKTIDVKGKQYAEVKERIKAFRSVYPEGAIRTEIKLIENDRCIVQATIYSDDGKILGTGTAMEESGSSFINKTSYLENCETSAVGRALGMCGFGIEFSVASADEVKNAINNQYEDRLLNNIQSMALHRALLNKLGSAEEVQKYLVNNYKKTSTEELTGSEYNQIVREFK